MTTWSTVKKNSHIDDDLTLVVKQQTHTAKVITARLKMPSFFPSFLGRKETDEGRKKGRKEGRRRE
jgi:hypothetical protein